MRPTLLPRAVTAPPRATADAATNHPLRGGIVEFEHTIDREFSAIRYLAAARPRARGSNVVMHHHRLVRNTVATRRRRRRRRTDRAGEAAPPLAATTIRAGSRAGPAHGRAGVCSCSARVHLARGIAPRHAHTHTASAESDSCAGWQGRMVYPNERQVSILLGMLAVADARSGITVGERLGRSDRGRPHLPAMPNSSTHSARAIMPSSDDGHAAAGVDACPAGLEEFSPRRACPALARAPHSRTFATCRCRKSARSAGWQRRVDGREGRSARSRLQPRRARASRQPEAARRSARRPAERRAQHDQQRACVRAVRRRSPLPGGDASRACHTAAPSRRRPHRLLIIHTR